MAPFRNRPGPLTKSSVNQAACRQNPSGTTRGQGGTTCAPHRLTETARIPIVPSSPKKRPNFNQYETTAKCYFVILSEAKDLVFTGGY
jgi:hypothetical protein